MKIKSQTIIFIGLIFLLIYSRFVNLGWGLPYPMHPDERNMANAVQNLNCEIQNSEFRIQNCFNPHFFAYGQFPLYLAYVGIWLWKLLSSNINSISFNEATIALRIISAIASIINAGVLVQITQLISKVKSQKYGKFFILYSLFFILVPYSIQFAHFGTTESLLMLFYCLIIYFSLKIIKQKILNTKYLILNSIAIGLAIATKVSAIWFVGVPMVAIIFLRISKINKLTQLIKFMFGSMIIAIIFSPYNLIDLPNFLSSMRYEADVGLGRYIAFYTRQFVDTIPVIFQSFKIFPYALGWPIFIFGLIGLIFLSWKNHGYNLLRFAFFIYFIPNVFVFAKWTRFMTPVMPILSIFSALIIYQLSTFLTYIINKNQNRKNSNKKVLNFYIFTLNIIFFILYFLCIVPGIAYLSIYQNPDVRFQASDWIYKNIPENNRILSETANVVDIPINPYNSYKNYNILSFDFYNVDENLSLQYDLQKVIGEADYIFVPSRRIWANHYCKKDISYKLLDISRKEKCQYLREKYPILNQYYEDLFSGKLGFKLVKEFSSYPKIQLFGKTIIQFPDEQAEETWSVFDHPVIRIYKREVVSIK